MTIDWNMSKVTAAVAIAGALGTGISLLAAQVGIRIVGPPESVAALTHEMWAWNTSQDSMIAITTRRVTSLEQTLQLIAYVQCVNLRLTNPALLPPACMSVRPPLEVP